MAESFWDVNYDPTFIKPLILDILAHFRKKARKESRRGKEQKEAISIKRVEKRGKERAIGGSHRVWI